jgi:hypothetical protein
MNNIGSDQRLGYTQEEGKCGNGITAALFANQIRKQLKYAWDIAPWKEACEYFCKH